MSSARRQGARQARSSARLRGAREARGSTSVEAAVIFPVFFIAILIVVQFSIWAHAEAVVGAAAGSGDQAARALGSTPAIGNEVAEQWLRRDGSGVLARTSVATVLGGDGIVTVSVSGTAESLLPGLGLAVSAVRSGTMQRFRISG